MNSLKLALVAGAFAMTAAAGAARADVVNFDEFTSPPVTCCYFDTGVTGPLVYAHVTVEDAFNGGDVMNGDGWLGLQTSGDNLFGTLGSGSINFNFNTAVTDVQFDMINGNPASNFVVFSYDQAHTRIGADPFFVAGFGDTGSVVHVHLSGPVWGVSINGNADFAVDTLSFNAGGAPEPAAWALMLVGFGGLGAALRGRRRSAVAA